MDTEQVPIILLGAARSGTKFVRDLIATSPEVVSIPFDINYVWRHGNEGIAHDELTTEMISPRIKKHVRKQVFRLARKNESSGTSKFFIEKTVSNTLRPDVVRHIFPEAKILYLERQGLDVVESGYRQWTAEVDRGYIRQKIRYFPFSEWRYAVWYLKNVMGGADSSPIWGPRYSGIDSDLERISTTEVCATQWVRSVQGWQDRTPLASMELELRYLDLFQDSPSEIARIAEFVGLDESRPLLEHIRRHGKLVQNTWPGAVPSVDRESAEAIVGAHAELRESGDQGGFGGQ